MKPFAENGINPDFDAGLTFATVLSKLGIIGGVGASVASFTAFVVGNYALISAILGGAQFFVRPMIIFPPLIGVGIIVSILSAISLWIIKAARLGEKSISKKLVEAFDDKNIAENFREEIRGFWERTLSAFQQAASGLDDEWALYVRNLREAVEGYNITEIQYKMASLKVLSSFFDNIPL